MRSGTGPLVVIIGLAMTVALVLVLFVNLGTRSELEAARGELAALKATVEAMEPGVTTDELEERIGELERSLRRLLFATTLADGGVDSSPDGTAAIAIAERLDEILDRIEALDDRVDEICDNVPVC